MNKWTSLKKNNYFKFIMFLTFISMVAGFLFYNKINSEINNLNINFENIIKNHSIYHLLFITFTFFFTFLILGTFIGIIVYMLEITSITMLCITLCKEFYFKGFLFSLIILIFKLFFLILLIYLISRSYKIIKLLLKKQISNKELFIIYFKEAIYTCLITISLELFNYFLGYNIITFFAKLLEIMV